MSRVDAQTPGTRYVFGTAAGITRGLPALLGAVAAVAAACSEPPRQPAARPAVAAPAAPAAPRTNDGGVAASNLSAEVDALLARGARSPRLIALLLARAEYLGRLADYDTALAVADELVAGAPEQADSYQARARVRARLHRFAGALEDLARAEALGAEVTADRASILIALDRVVDVSDGDGDAALVAEARGDLDGAIVLHTRALAEHRGVSPFPVAWRYMQLGMLHERAGHTALAAACYEAAIARLPDYAHAVGHLAALEAARGERARAIAMIEPLLATTDDPEYRAQLAALRADPALLADARAGYDDLIARHPEAFADHAARFWLGPGADPARALELAELNLRVRQTEEAYQLALDAAHAAGAEPVEQCALAERASARPNASAYTLFAAARAARACGRPTWADELLGRADMARTAR